MNGVVWSGKLREVVWTIIAVRVLPTCVCSAATDQDADEVARLQQVSLPAGGTGSVPSGTRLKDNQSTFLHARAD